MSIKELVPNTDALAEKLNAVLHESAADIHKAVGPLEHEYRRVKKRQKIGGVLVVCIFATLGFLDVLNDIDIGWGSFLGDVVALILGILLFPVMAVLGFVAYRLLRDKNNVVARFNAGINTLLFPKVIATFGLEGSHIAVKKPTTTSIFSKLSEINKKPLWKMGEQGGVNPEVLLEESRQVLELLDHSELVTESRNTVVVDDMVHIPWGSGTLFLSELDLKNVTGSGKNRSVKNIFSGYFVSFDTNLQLTGKTFVTTEGDKKGFGHKSFLDGLNGKGVQETELEWNEFERLLHVATDNPTEARYVLTTNFMADLYDWWKDKKTNIRISFIGSRMYMLFPDKGVRFNNTIPSLETAELHRYAMTIATPLMYVLHLIEDVPAE